jgi:hypothetical protein
MPAIQIDQLRIQSTNLAGKFSYPEAFLAAFQSILENYVDLTYKPSAVQATSTRLQTYRTPQPVMRQIERDLKFQMAVYPQEVFLTLANALRRHDVLEYQMLAVYILGRTPLKPPEPVLQIIFEWLAVNQDYLIKEALLTTGLDQYRRESPDLWLNRVKSWIEDPDGEKAGMGLHALLPCLEDRQFSNLPAVFTLLSELLSVDHPELEPELFTAMRSLLHRSPVETVYLVREILSRRPQSKSTASRVFRKLLPEFPHESQPVLRQLLFNPPVK